MHACRSKTIAAVHRRINCYEGQAQAPLEKQTTLLAFVRPAVRPVMPLLCPCYAPVVRLVAGTIALPNCTHNW